MKKLSLIIAIMLILLAASLQSKPIVYVSPMPGSEYNPCGSSVLIRFSDEINPHTVSSELFDISGNKSGKHTCTFTFSDDMKTLIIKPQSEFSPSETISVKLKQSIENYRGEMFEGKEFNFKTSAFSETMATTEKESQGLMNDKVKSSNILADTLPADLMPLTVKVNGEVDKGNLLIAYMPSAKGAYTGYLMMTNDTGGVLKYKKITVSAYDLTIQPNGQMTFMKGTSGYILDNDWNIIDSVSCQNGYKLDIHEFLILPNGHYLVEAYDPQYIDMSKIVTNGIPNARVSGVVIQELDRNKNLVFQWRTWDHFKFEDSYQSMTGANVDLFHMNAMFLDSDGNLICCFRHSSELTKINRTTGEIIWRMGGKNNQFTFIGENEANAPNYFSYQHDVERLPNGNLTLFDNGNQHKPAFSRGVEYTLNEDTKTATLVWECRHDSDIYASAMGSFQRLENGNTLIGWGSAGSSGKAQITEFRPDKSVAMEITVPSGYSVYRARKFHMPACESVASVSIIDVEAGNSYTFDDQNGETGVEIMFNELTTPSYANFNVQKFDCPPVSPIFDTVPKVIYPYRIILTAMNVDSYKGTFHINISKFPNIANPVNTSAYYKDGSGVFHRINTKWDDIGNGITFQSSALGEFIFGIPQEAMQAQKTILVIPDSNSNLNVRRATQFKWSFPGEFDFTELLVSDNKDFTNLLIDTVVKGSDMFNLEPKLTAGEYYWKARTQNRAGLGEWSEINSFTLSNPFLNISSPNGGEVYKKDSSNNIIRWNHNLADTFRVELYRNGVFSLLIRDNLNSPVGAVVWKVPMTTEDDTTYTIKVRSISDSTLIDESDSFFSIVSVSSVNDEKLLTGNISASTFPNPFTANTNIEFYLKLPGETVVNIYDVEGRSVANLMNEYLDAGKYCLNWNPKSLVPGTYICRIESGNQTIELKLVLTD